MSESEGGGILAISAAHMVRLTGLTARQLAYWDSKGFFKPEFAADDRRSPHSRVYSFRDAVGLRTVSKLLNEHGVSITHLRQVAAKLAACTDRPWSELKLHVWNRRVQFKEPETGATRDVLHGQYVLLPIIDVIHEVETGVEQLKRRDPATVGRFERHKHVSRNDLVVAGTRVPVATVIEYLDDGYSAPQIVAEFPSLTEDDVKAAERNGRTELAA